MAYTQLRDANWRVPYTGGWCLKYVQDSFGTDHPYASAIDAWNANYGNGNHPNELPPVGKTVPVYFSLGNVPAGHVADSLDDGTVASSTQSGYHLQGYIHPSLQDLINVYGKYNGGCSYLGWSEYVGTVRVVAPVAAPVTNVTQGVDMIDQNTLNVLFDLFLGRAPDPGAIAHYVGNYTTSFVVDDLNRSPEHAAHIASLNNQMTVQAQALADATSKAANLQAQVDAITAELATAQATDTVDKATVKDLTSQLKSAQADLDAAKAQVVAPAPTPVVTAPVTPITVVPTQVLSWQTRLINWLNNFIAGKK